MDMPRPSPRTNRTRRVPHPVLIGHAPSLRPVTGSAPTPSPCGTTRVRCGTRRAASSTQIATRARRGPELRQNLASPETASVPPQPAGRLHPLTARGCVQPALSALLSKSRAPYVRALFPPPSPPGSPGGAEGARAHGGRSTLIFESVSSQFRAQLQSLIRTLDSTSPHFVRSIAPLHRRSGVGRGSVQ